jgi:dihydroxyacetone kinase
MGIAVETVLVGDDIALPNAQRPRGVAGTLFVHKVAGELARSGAPLASVTKAAERVAAAVRSLGLSFSSCTVPGVPAEARLGPDEVELGLGIHGEPGAEKIAYRPVRDLAAMLVSRLAATLGDSKGPVALLVNDLGGVPPIEMAVATRSILSAMTHEVGLVFGPARSMTSLDMKGLSVSVLPLDEETSRALLAPVGPAAWPVGRRVGPLVTAPLPAALTSRAFPPSAHPRRRRSLQAIAERLVSLEAELNALDAKVGDGDTGSTFATAARAVLTDLDRLPLGDPPALCAAIAARLSAVMGGSSGVLISIGAAAMGSALAGGDDWTLALRAGLRRIEEYGGAREGDRTLLDALGPALSALESGSSLATAAVAASQGAERTKTMQAKAGRSSYVQQDALLGHVDPGALAFAAVFDALASAN